MTMRYKLLGRTGLRVSELCLGAMTFGDGRGWDAGKEEAARIHIQLGFPHDFDAGHRRAYGDTWPLIDNHRTYTPGPSEEEA